MTAASARVILQAASMCLQYPDAELLAQLPVVAKAVEALPPSASKERLRSFLDRRPSPDHYVELFDTRKRCCLYLTWWSDGETRRRGSSLAALKERYRGSGADFTHSELPDFLPAVLEFAATVDLTAGLALLQEHRPGLELLRLALLETGTAYAAPVEAVCALLPGASPADVEAAKALARSGPPREVVGLELAPYSAGAGR